MTASSRVYSFFEVVFIRNGYDVHDIGFMYLFAKISMVSGPAIVGCNANNRAWVLVVVRKDVLNEFNFPTALCIFTSPFDVK